MLFVHNDKDSDTTNTWRPFGIWQFYEYDGIIMEYKGVKMSSPLKIQYVHFGWKHSKINIINSVKKEQH